MYHRLVINADQLVNGLWMGSVLICFALAPGLIRRCLDTLRSLAFPWTALRVRVFPSYDRKSLTLEPPRWLAFVGVGIMLIAVLAYLA